MTLRSIDDDDLCSGCANCRYQPGENSGCVLDWPGVFPTEGPQADYSVKCLWFVPIKEAGDNWTEEAKS